MTGLLVPVDVEAVVAPGELPDGLPGDVTGEVEAAMRPGCPEVVCAVVEGFDWVCALITGLAVDVEAEIPVTGLPDGFPDAGATVVEEAIRPSCREGV